MKTLKVLLIANFYFISTFSFGQWVAQNSGTTVTLNAVYFTDENTGYAGGSGITNATLLKTIDGGETWNDLNVNSIYEINSISFGSNNTGYVITSISELFKTTDAGANWVNTINFGVFGGRVEFLNADTGFVANGDGEIFRTLDGGVNWDSTLISGFGNPNAVHFPSIQVGYIANYWGSIAKTTDMGITWSIISQPTSNPIWDIHFVSDTVGYAVGGDGISSLILKTIDGGSNWTVQVTSPPTSVSPNAVFFTDANTGYCGNSTIYKTSDGGGNWNSMTLNWQITDLFFPSANIGYAVGYNGTILKLENNITGINEEKNINTALKIRPNPTSGKCIIDLSNFEIENMKIILLNSMGQTITSFTANSNTFTVDLGNLTSGIYFLQIRDKKTNKVFTERLIKTNVL
jgi:photosystem II stability/assembly factor-like uncharacterized protein